VSRRGGDLAQPFSGFSKMIRHAVKNGYRAKIFPGPLSHVNWTGLAAGLNGMPATA
jgi:hypothetical protein